MQLAMPACYRIPLSLVIIFCVSQIAFPTVIAKHTYCKNVPWQASGLSLLQHISLDERQVAQLEATSGTQFDVELQGESLNLTEPEQEREPEPEPANHSSNGTQLKPEPEQESPNGTEFANGSLPNGTEFANGSLACPNETGQIPLEAKLKFQESCHMHLNESLGVNESLGEIEKETHMSGSEFFKVMESMCQEGTPEHDACFGLVTRYFESCDVNEANVTRWKESMDQFCGMLRLFSSAASSSVPSEGTVTTEIDQM